MNVFKLINAVILDNIEMKGKKRENVRVPITTSINF